jgi:hypothetical protein
MEGSGERRSRPCDVCVCVYRTARGEVGTVTDKRWRRASGRYGIAEVCVDGLDGRAGVAGAQATRRGLDEMRG